MMPQGNPFVAYGTIALTPGSCKGYFGEVWWAGCVVALILLLGVNANGCVTSQPSKEEVRKTTNSFEFRSGVIVDPGGLAVYLMNIQRGIDAVNLVSGKLLWRTDRAAKPLLYHEDLLVAQTEPAVGQQFLRIAY